jgi:DNA-binding NarL/FixJ family response regulator
MEQDEVGAGRAVVVELRGIGALEGPLREVLRELGMRVVGAGRSSPATVVVWGMGRDGATARVQRVRRVRPTTEVLVLLEAPTRSEVGALLGAGARAVVDRGAGPLTIADAVVSVARGYLVLPATERHALVQPSAFHELDQAALGWVRTLASGVSMIQLAEEEGCSERAMYRRMRAVYDQLGVDDRAEAIALLARARWFSEV